MLKANKSDKAFDVLMLFLLIYCLVRFSLVMTTSVSIFNLMYIIILGGTAISYFLAKGGDFCNKFFGINLIFLISCVIVVLLAIIFTIHSGYQNTASNYFKQLIVLLLIWGIYVFLSCSDGKTKKIFVATYLICMFISAIYTSYVAMNGDEEIIRSTASGIYDNSFRFTYGGFDFIYALVLVYTILLTILCVTGKELNTILKIVFTIMEIVFAFTIILSGYGTAFALLLIFTVWQITPKGIFRIVASFFIAMLVFVFPTWVTNTISAIPFIPELTSTRINDLILSFSGQGSSGYITDDGQRLDRIIWSLDAFFENPLIGAFMGNSDLPLGYHTEWIDQLARYGVFYSVFNVAFWIATYKKIKSNATMNPDYDISVKCIRNSFCMFLILGFLDPISMVVTVCPLFILAPFLSAVIKKKRS